MNAKVGEVGVASSGAGAGFPRDQNFARRVTRHVPVTLHVLTADSWNT